MRMKTVQLLIFLLECGIVFSDFIPRTHGTREGAESIEQESQFNNNILNTGGLLKNLPKGVKFAEENGVIIVYGILYPNGSKPGMSDEISDNLSANVLSSKIVTLLRNEGQRKTNHDLRIQKVVYQETKKGSLAKDDIIFGKPKYDILPTEPNTEIITNNYQALPQLDQHLFNLSTSLSFSAVPEEHILPKKEVTPAQINQNQAYGSNNPLFAEPITRAMPSVKIAEEDHHHKVVQGHKLPAVTLIYPEDNFLDGKYILANSDKKHRKDVKLFKNAKHFKRYDATNIQVEEEFFANSVGDEIQEYNEEPFLETEKWQIFWDTLYQTWYYYNKLTGNSSWTKPQDLQLIELKDPTASNSRHPKMKDEVGLINDMKYNPLPPPSTYKQNIPLYNPAQDFYLFTNPPVSQSDNLRIPDTIPLPPDLPPHLARRQNRRVEIVDAHMELPRPPGLPMKYNMPPYVQLLGREQRPLGYDKEEKGREYRRFQQVRAMEEEGMKESTTTDIVKSVWRNTLANLFSNKEDKDDKRKENRRKRKKERKSNPIFDMVIDIASKSAVKYVKNVLLNNNSEEEKNDKDNEDTKISEEESEEKETTDE